MPVKLAQNDMVVEPNTVYIIPPNALLALFNGKLQLLGPTEDLGVRLPIDYFSLTQRRPPRHLLHHSDRGSQYTSLDYQNRLTASDMIVSMSRVGNCWDNAPMESFWATLKRECADVVFASHSQARVELFSYIMGFYNRQRRHSTLGYVSPFTCDCSATLKFSLSLERT